MIISHKYRFIFVKTRKTAGTSVEAYLSQHCGDGDVLTPVHPPLPGHMARNHRGRWNVLREVAGAGDQSEALLALRHWLKGQRYWNHTPARMIRTRCPALIWERYLKFTIDRDPFEKVMSQFSRRRNDAGEDYDLDAYFAETSLPLNLPLSTDHNGRLMVDRILRYEDLDAELGRLFGELGVPWAGTLDVRAKSGFRSADRRPAREVLSERHKDRIREVFAREFDLNGYPTQ
jgi:hypothetical protein